MSDNAKRGSRAPGAESSFDRLGRVVGSTVSNVIEKIPAYKIFNSGLSAMSNSKRGSLDEAGVLQSVGNIVTGNLDYKRSLESAMRAERFSAREAEKTRRWQEEMSNTAYSRAIADLKRNGINPYAIGYFSPASTPAGATGSAYNTSPHSAAANALGALGLVERAYSNSKKREIEERSNLLRLVFAFLSGGD